MEYIILLLIIIITVLVGVLIRKDRTITALTDLDKVNFEERKRLKDEVLSRKDAFEQLRSYADTIDLKYKDYITLIITSPIKVYTQSNFYSNHSFFSYRFYAKINNKDRNNKAEGIPVLEIPNNKNKILNLYKLKNSIRQYPNEDMEILIKNSIQLKETLIEELGNKVLKSYHR